MAGWRIVAFDRARGRGTIASGVGELDFDASVAHVDAFDVGEEVDVTLTAGGEGFTVTSIAPHGFRAPFEAPPAQSAADLSLVHHAVHGRRARLTRAEEDLVAFEVEDDTYRPRRWLTFGAPCYVAAPTEIEIAALRVFEPDAVARAAPGIAALWPRLPKNVFVFRVDPPGFREGAILVIARSISLVTNELPPRSE